MSCTCIEWTGNRNSRPRSLVPVSWSLWLLFQPTASHLTLTLLGRRPANSHTLQQRRDLYTESGNSEGDIHFASSTKDLLTLSDPCRAVLSAINPEIGHRPSRDRHTRKHAHRYLWRSLSPVTTTNRHPKAVIGICAGKHSLAEFLVQQHQFLRLHLPSGATSTPSEEPDDIRRLQPSVSDEKGTRGLTFPDVDALLDFVTKRWREHWVLTDIWDDVTLEILCRRPFFMLISVDAPISRRFNRFSSRCRKRNLAPPSLPTFIAWNDLNLYARQGIAFISSQAQLHILNDLDTVQSFHEALSTLQIVSSTRLRPAWDAYFMTLASLAAQRSNCMKRRVGCVLINNNRVISTGYNGTPRNIRNCNEGGCARCNNGPGAGTGLSTCLCLHAEENALLEAGRERIRDGSVLYCDTCPCLTCSVKITQVGISEVVFSQSYNMDKETAAIFSEAGVKLRQFSPPKSGLVNLRAAGSSTAKSDIETALMARNGTV